MATLSKKHGSWYIVTFEKASRKRRWIKIGRCPRVKAYDIFHKFEAEVIDQKFGVQEDDKNITFGTFTEKYLQYSKEIKAPRTYDRDHLCARNLIAFFGTSRRLVDLNSRLVENFTLKRLKEVTPRTVNIELGFIKKMYRYAERRHYIKRAPFGAVEMVKETKRPPRFLLQDEIRALTEAASPWLSPFITLGLNTGMRSGEILNLKWKHINFEKRYIMIQSHDDFETKTRDFRSVPVNQALYDDLMYLREHWPHPTHNRWEKRRPQQMLYIICKEDGSRVNDVKTAFRAACKKAGLEDVTPHTLRHTYASQLVMAGINLRVVQHYLGHTTIQTTMRYAHLSTEHLANHADEICFRTIVSAPVFELSRKKNKSDGN